MSQLLLSVVDSGDSRVHGQSSGWICDGLAPPMIHTLHDDVMSGIA
jgi:hypothetical protein